MKFNTRQLSPETDTSSGAAPETEASIANFDQFSEDHFDEIGLEEGNKGGDEDAQGGTEASNQGTPADGEGSGSPADEAEQKITDETKKIEAEAEAKKVAEEAAAAAEKTPEQVAADKLAEEKADAEATKDMSEEEKAEYFLEKEKTALVADLEGQGKKEEPKLDAEGNPIVPNEEEPTWKDVATKFDVKIENDTFEDFSKGVEEKIKTIETNAKKEALEAKWEEDIQELPVENQAIILGLKNGLAVEEVIAPFERLESLKALDDADLVAEDLKGQGYDADLVELKLAKMAENDEIELAAGEIRKVITDQEASLKQKHLDAIKEIDTKNQEKITAAKAKDLESVKESINKLDQFMDTPVNDKIKELLTKKYEAGKYHEDFKDSDIISEFILFREFGSAFMANMKNKMRSSILSDTAAKMHNTKPKVTSGGSATTDETAKSSIGNWGALDALDDIE